MAGGSGAPGDRPWRGTVGQGPHKVTALELTARKGVVYLRWRARGNWVVESLGITCRTASGRLIKAQCEAALRSARAKSDELLAQTAPSAPVAPRSALTLADTHAVVFDAATGRWRAEAARLRAIVRAESAPDDAAA